MPTKALRSSAPARISRSLREETCPVAKLMREAAACWRLIKTEHVDSRIRKLSIRDRSDMTPAYVRQRLHRRLKGIETLASELQPTSLVGAAYQMLLAMDLATLDDEIDAACDKNKFGDVEHLRDTLDAAGCTLISSYLAIRTTIHDPDLDIVERPHDLKGWNPNRTVTALLADLKKREAEAVG